MRLTSAASFLGAFAAAALMSSLPAHAVTSNPQCVQEAHAANQLCKSTCQDNFVVAKDMCRNVDHACADACRAGREACVAGPLGALQSCLDDCNSALDTARTNCRAQFGKNGTTPDPVQLDTCIDGAQTTAFQCRDTCRENLDRAALKQCRITFQACIRACPPPPAAP